MSKGKTKIERLAQGVRTRENILGFIIAYMEEHKIPPTIREISEGVRINTTSVTAYHLEKLQAAGSIERDRKISRGIRIPGFSEGEYSIEYRCHYPFGCSFQSKKPGRCQIHGSELIPFVSIR